jgi:hypothetical protein
LITRNESGWQLVIVSSSSRYQQDKISGMPMKQFSLSANHSIGPPLKTGRPDPVKEYHRCRACGSIAAAAVLTCLAAGLLAVAQPCHAQTSSRQDLRNDNAVIRERARRDFQDRIRRGHEAGRQRAIDTNERVEREHQRQQDQLDILRRQR